MGFQIVLYAIINVAIAHKRPQIALPVIQEPLELPGLQQIMIVYVKLAISIMVKQIVLNALISVVPAQ